MATPRTMVSFGCKAVRRGKASHRPYMVSGTEDHVDHLFRRRCLDVEVIHTDDHVVDGKAGVSGGSVGVERRDAHTCEGQ